MKKFFLRLLTFIGFTFILYIVSLFVLGYFEITFKRLNFGFKEPGRLLLRIDDIQKYKKLDILFLGSSHAFMGFDTRIFKEYGFTTFNLGSLAQTPVQTKYLYEKYAKNIETSLIIYEVNPLIFSNDGTEAMVDLVTSESIDMNMLKMIFQYNHPTIYNTTFYMIIRQLLNFQLKYMENLSGYVQGGGFVESTTSNPDYSKDFKSDTVLIKDKQLEAFKEIITLFNSRNQKYILVQCPVSGNYYKSISNIREFDNEMSQYGKYYNFNTILNLNDSSDFTDYHHLNQNGVNKFNPELIHILQQNHN